MTGAPAPLEVDLRVRPALRSSLIVSAQFRAQAGMTVLFGPSGAGKTTLLMGIAGLLRPESGRVAMGGEPWFDAAAGVNVPTHRRRLGFVMQSLALFPHLTALQNVAYGLRRLPRQQQLATAQEWLARMRVAQVATRRPATLSGGEAQRVALARALAPGPRLLLLDEAFTALDEPLRRGLQDDVRALIAQTRIVAVQITHRPEDAREWAEQVVVLEAGRVRAVGAADAVLPPRASV